MKKSRGVPDDNAWCEDCGAWAYGGCLGCGGAYCRPHMVDDGHCVFCGPPSASELAMEHAERDAWMGGGS